MVKTIENNANCCNKERKNNENMTKKGETTMKNNEK